MGDVLWVIFEFHFCFKSPFTECSRRLDDQEVRADRTRRQHHQGVRQLLEIPQGQGGQRAQIEASEIEKIHKMLNLKPKLTN